MGKVFEINLSDGVCSQCKARGLIAPNGLCLKCATKNIGKLSREQIQDFVQNKEASNDEERT